MKLSEVKGSSAPLIYHAIKALLPKGTLYFTKMASSGHRMRRARQQAIFKVTALVGFNEGDSAVIAKGMSKTAGNGELYIPVKDDEDWTVEPFLPGHEGFENAYLITRKPV